MQRVRNFLVAVVVFLLAGVFVLQFGGPQAEGCAGGGGVAYAARVYGANISEGDLRAAYLLAGGDRFPPQFQKQHHLKNLVLQGLVDRSLLAREARKIGFDVAEEEVLQKVAEDGLVYLSMSVDAPPFLASGPQNLDFTDSDGNFDQDNMRRFIHYRLRRSIKEFAESQAEEILAHEMRQAVMSSVQVSPAELWEAYVREKEKVVLKYARFSPLYYREQLQPTAEQMQGWMAQNRADVDSAYEKQKNRYTGLEKQVRARHILIKVEEEAPDEEVQAAKERAAELLQRARGGEDFAELARHNSEDAGSARKGGDLGYNPRGRMLPAFDEAQFSLKPGEVSDLVRSRFGFHIIKVEGIREGDVPEQEAKREVAEQLFRERQAQKLAKSAAEKALARLHAGETPEAVQTDRMHPPSGEPQTEGDEPEAESAAAEQSAGTSEDPLAPKFRDTRPFGRADIAVPGPFDSRPLVKAAFEMTEETPLPAQPMKLGEDWFVYRLESRVHAKREDFTQQERQRISEMLLGLKRRAVLATYVHDLRRKAEVNNALQLNNALLADVDYGEQ